MQKLHSESAPIRPSIVDGQREALRIRSETMELLAGTRRAIAQSRLLMAEADALICSVKATFPQSAKSPK
jgi:hypothetical protein